MICPNCKCEYIKGVTQCADCGVPLVDSLDTSAAGAPDDPGIVAIWEGSDPGERELVKDALDKAGIPVAGQESPGHLFFPSLEPKAGIYVSTADEIRAKKVLVDLGHLVDPGGMTEDELKALELTVSDGPISEDESTEPADPAEPWEEDSPVVEVWDGLKEDFADTLVACLREVGIESRKFSEAGRWCLLVRQEQEPRAREVVREVVEASPPQ
jgi:hypothetical protein